jgi:hypothetical protein
MSKIFLRRRHTYRLYRQTKNKTQSFFLVAVLVATSLGSALPLAAVGVVSAITGVSYTATGFGGLTWYEDRRLPSGGWTVSDDTLSMTVDGDNPPTNGFYAFEGVKATLPADTHNVSAKLFVDPAWVGQSVIAGMWGESPDPASPASPAWPTLEFNNVDHATASVDVWDTFDGQIKGVTTVTYGSTIELEIQANTITNSINYYLNGSLIFSSPAEGTGPLRSVIFNNYNDGAAGSNYTTTWSELYIGTLTKPATPTNLRWVVNGSSLSCGNATSVPVGTPTWGASAGANSYAYQFMRPGSSNWESGGTYSEPTTGPTAYGTSEGVEGIWKFRVQATGPTGTSEWSNVCAVSFDKTTPTTPTAVFNQPPESAIANLTKNLGLAFTLHDTSSDVTRYQLRYWNNVPSSPYKESSPWNPTDISGYMPNSQTYQDVFSQGQGQHYFSFSACDAAGNCSPYTTPSAVYYDSTVAVASLDNVNGQPFGSTVNTYMFDEKLIVRGSYSDNHAANYLQLELVKDGNLVNVISKHGTVTNNVLATFDATGLANGQYELYATATDMAGNVGTRQRFTFALDNVVPTPIVVGQNFNTHADEGYSGINVGFQLSNFSAVSGVAVTLRAGENNLVTNVGNANLLSLINDSDVTELSTPFITIPGTYEEEYWNLGAYAWSSSSPMPTSAVVTVTGTDASGAPRTATTTLSPLSQGDPSWPTFASVLPAAQPSASTGNPQNDNSSATGGSVQGAQTTVAQVIAATSFRTATARVQGTGASQDAEVLGATDAAVEETAASTTTPRVLAAETETVKVENADSKKAGSGFLLWWLPAAVVVFVVFWWLLAGKRRKHDEENR